MPDALDEARAFIRDVVAYKRLDPVTAEELFLRHDNDLRPGPDGALVYVDERGEALTDPQTGEPADTRCWLRRMRVLSPHLVGEGERPERRLMGGPEVIAALRDSIRYGKVRIDQVLAALDHPIIPEDTIPA